MRGADSKQEAMFSYVSAEARVPAKHPLRPIRAMIAEALAQMDRRFERLYSQTGRPSIAPERLIRALLLQVLYSIRSERLLIEQLEYNLLFRADLHRLQPGAHAQSSCARVHIARMPS